MKIKPATILILLGCSVGMSASLFAQTTVYTETFPNSTGSAIALSTTDWQTHIGATATDRSTNTAFATGPVITNLNGVGNVAGYVVTTQQNTALTWTEEFSPINRSQTEISTLSFVTNNANTTDAYRFAIRIDVAGTPRWFATDATYIQNAAGTSNDMNTNGELKVFHFTTAGAAWRELDFTPGTTLALSGTTLADPLPMGNLIAAGIYNDLNTNTLRWDQFEIAVIPEPGLATALLGFIMFGFTLFWTRRKGSSNN